jgi:hypothetical protein
VVVATRYGASAFLGRTTKRLSRCVRFVLAPGEKTARIHRRSNHGYRVGGGLHAAYFTGAQRGHALSGVVNLFSAVQAHLVGLLFERKRPRLTPMAAAENNVLKETKQICDPSHINAPLFERWVLVA